MITFLFVAAGAILVIAAIAVAYSANQRKRAGQSGKAEVTAQVEDQGTPRIGRAPGAD